MQEAGIYHPFPSVASWLQREHERGSAATSFNAEAPEGVEAKLKILGSMKQVE